MTVPHSVPHAGDRGRRLVLLRHAKAEPAGGIRDELRPLSLVGRRQSGDVGARLVADGLLPEHVLVSSAVRTRQTWELVRAASGDEPRPEVDVDDRLYLADVPDLVDLLRGIDDRVRTVLVVGHEPTMSSAAAVLAAGQDGDTGHLAQVRAGLPTAGLAVLQVATWSGIAAGGARLLDVVRPAR